MLIFGSGYAAVTYNYDSPTLADMRAKCARALRDDTGDVFTPTDLDAFIQTALVEVSRVYPKDIVEVFDLVNGVLDYPVSHDSIFRVEVMHDDHFVSELESGGGNPENGWMLHAHTLYLPSWFAFDEDHDSLRVFGYAPRNAAQQDTDRVDVDLQGEVAIRQFVQLQGYQALANDRGLFSQWNALPHNTDVNMNQLLGLVQLYQKSWDDERKRLRKVRR